MKELILGLYGLSKNKNNISGYNVINDNEAIEILKKAWDITTNRMKQAGWGVETSTWDGKPRLVSLFW